MTAEEFAVWAEARPEKHWELFDGEPILQQSQNWGHARHILSLRGVLPGGNRGAALIFSSARKGLS